MPSHGCHSAKFLRLIDTKILYKHISCFSPCYPYTCAIFFFKSAANNHHALQEMPAILLVAIKYTNSGFSEWCIKYTRNSSFLLWSWDFILLTKALFCNLSSHVPALVCFHHWWKFDVLNMHLFTLSTDIYLIFASKITKKNHFRKLVNNKLQWH